MPLPIVFVKCAQSFEKKEIKTETKGRDLRRVCANICKERR